MSKNISLLIISGLIVFVLLISNSASAQFGRSGGFGAFGLLGRALGLQGDLGQLETPGGFDNRGLRLEGQWPGDPSQRRGGCPPSSKPKSRGGGGDIVAHDTGCLTEIFKENENNKKFMLLYERCMGEGKLVRNKWLLKINCTRKVALELGLYDCPAKEEGTEN